MRILLTASDSSKNRRSLALPRVVFGSSALGNLYQALPPAQKLAITRAWFEFGPSPVVIDSAGKYGAGLALECIGNNLRELGVPSDGVVISNKLGWFRTPLRSMAPTFEPGAWMDLHHDAEQRISRRGILDCWEQGCELLGDPYRPQLVSVHDPDDYVAGAQDRAERTLRFANLYEAYEALDELKGRSEVSAIGIGSKEWRVAREVARNVQLDWVMVANSLTMYTHSPELLTWLDELGDRGIKVINSAVFNAGFLIGGKFFDYRIPSDQNLADRRLFEWRERFFRLCRQHDVTPAAACVQFGLSHPHVSSVALNSSHPNRVAQNVALVDSKIPDTFWNDAKQFGIIDPSYPYVGQRIY